MKKSVFLSVLMMFLVLLGGCQKQHSYVDHSIETSSEDKIISEPEKWDGVTESGVDEQIFLQSMDEDLLKKVASELQTITSKIGEKERADYEYSLRGDWLKDVLASKEYKTVINYGNKAMKPLYYIIYKSEYQGLYEYICSKALSEIYGYKNQNNDGTMDWATSKEFLAVITKQIIKDKN